jgi:hypothetical protein
MAVATVAAADMEDHLADEAKPTAAKAVVGMC